MSNLTGNGGNEFLLLQEQLRLIKEENKSLKNYISTHILDYFDQTYGAITIGSNGWTEARPSKTNTVFGVLTYWSGGNAAAFSLVGSGSLYWIIGAPNQTITNPRIRYFYYKDNL